MTRSEESKLFIDINTKQRPVPNGLLLNIKSLADYEDKSGTLMREIFDYFHAENDSFLLGLTSPANRNSNKVSRVTFNSAFILIIKTFGIKDFYEIYEICNAYIGAFYNGLKKLKLESCITNPTVFKSVISIFPHIAKSTRDKYSNYKMDSFSEILTPLFENIKPSKIIKPV